MITRSSFVTVVAVVALISVAFGVCCAPLMARTPDPPVHDSGMPMEHGDDHEGHGALASCCSAHDTQMQTEGVALAPPSDAVVVFEPSLEFLAVERLSGSKMLGLPPGARDLTSVFCTLLI